VPVAVVTGGSRGAGAWTNAPPTGLSISALAVSPEFTGHVIAALAADPDVLTVSGRALIGAELAQKYGITDRDGRQPPSFRELMQVEPANCQGRIER